MLDKTINDVEAFLTLLKRHDIVVFDTETSGLNAKKDHLLSFSAIRYRFEDKQFKEIKRIDQFFNPEICIPWNITKINHITNDMVRNCPTEESCYDIISSIIDEDTIICGYNVTFDIRFVSAILARFDQDFDYYRVFDVLPLAKELLKGITENQKLATVTEYFEANKGLEFHNSLDDVIATKRVMVKLINMYLKKIK